MQLFLTMSHLKYKLQMAIPSYCQKLLIDNSIVSRSMGKVWANSIIPASS